MYQRDIAEKLGVSQTSVSLVLNNPETERVSTEKRKKILDFIKDNRFSSKSRHGKTGNIQLFLRAYEEADYQPFRNRFIMGVESAAAKQNYNVIVKKYRDNLVIPHAKVDGIILHDVGDEKRLKNLADHIPVVVLNRVINHPLCDMVYPDNCGGINLAMEHLLSKGHSKIAYFGIGSSEVRSNPNYLDRINSFHNACRNFGIKNREGFVQLPEIEFPGVEPTIEVIGNTLKYWLELPESPTAVICCNDVYALLMIRQANMLGLKLPEQLSIIGTDNINSCELSWPALTSIDHNAEEMGRLSLETLLRRIETPKRPASKVSCSAVLKIRESVANLVDAIKPTETYEHIGS